MSYLTMPTHIIPKSKFAFVIKPFVTFIRMLGKRHIADLRASQVAHLEHKDRIKVRRIPRPSLLVQLQTDVNVTIIFSKQCVLRAEDALLQPSVLCVFYCL